MAELNTMVEVIKERVDRHEGLISGLSSHVDTLITNLALYNERSSNIESKLDALILAIDSLKPTEAQLKMQWSNQELVSKLEQDMRKLIDKVSGIDEWKNQSESFKESRNKAILFMIKYKWIAGTIIGAIVWLAWQIEPPSGTGILGL